MREFIVNVWNFIFNAELSPLRHIPDASTRHYVLQLLGFMWAASFATAIGSYTVFTASMVGHSVLIAAAAITAATYAAASKKPDLFERISRETQDNEQE